MKNFKIGDMVKVSPYSGKKFKIIEMGKDEIKIKTHWGREYWRNASDIYFYN